MADQTQEALDVAYKALQQAAGAVPFAGVTLTPTAALPGGIANKATFGVPGVKANAVVVPLRNSASADGTLGQLTTAIDTVAQTVDVISGNAADVSLVQALIFNPA